MAALAAMEAFSWDRGAPTLRIEDPVAITLPHFRAAGNSVYRLSLAQCPVLSALPPLPVILEYLHVYMCPALRSFGPLPPKLVRMELTDCASDLLRTADLPEHLHALELTKMALPDTTLPARLDVFVAVQCGGMRLPALFAGLRTLTLHCCNELDTLQHLPPGLVTLTVTGCTALRCIRHLPPALTELTVSDCGALRALPPLPPTLTKLEVAGCGALRALPPLAHLTAARITVDCTGCASLAHVPPLPPSLWRLKCSKCPSVRQWPVLPEGVRNVECSGANVPALMGYFRYTRTWPAVHVQFLCNSREDEAAVPDFPQGALRLMAARHCTDRAAVATALPSPALLYV
jgi:hypothetical protein